MSKDVQTTVDALDDKQAIYVAQKLGEAVFKRSTAPAFDTIARVLDEACLRAGMQVAIAQHPEWSKATLRADTGGQAARAALRAWASDPGLAPAVERAIEQFKTSKQDLGILSVPLALGLTYALIAMDLDLDLGFVKIKKKGLSGKQQTEIIKQTVEPVIKGITGTGTVGI